MATSQAAVAMKHCDLDVALTHSERERLAKLGEPLQLEVEQLVRVLVHSLLLGAIHEDCTISSLLPEPKQSAITISLHLSEQQLHEAAALSALQFGVQAVEESETATLGALAQVLLQGALMRPELLTQLLKVAHTPTVRLDPQRLQRLRSQSAGQEGK